MNDEETVEALNGMWSNFCVTDAYEPGSVVKPIVMAGALEMVYLLLAFVIAGIVLYLFPVLSRFTMDAFSCFKLALFMVFKHLPTTILLLLIVTAGIVSALLIPVPMIFVMPGVCCYVGSFLMERILRKYMAKPETKEDEEKWYYR